MVSQSHPGARAWLSGGRGSSLEALPEAERIAKSGVCHFRQGDAFRGVLFFCIIFEKYLKSA